jgi:hypothetical protein
MSRFSIQSEWISRAGVARVGGRAVGGRAECAGQGGTEVAPDLRGHRSRPAQPPGACPGGCGGGVGHHDSSLRHTYRVTTRHGVSPAARSSVGSVAVASKARPH